MRDFKCLVRILSVVADTTDKVKLCMELVFDAECSALLLLLNLHSWNHLHTAGHLGCGPKTKMNDDDRCIYNIYIYIHIMSPKAPIAFSSLH